MAPTLKIASSIAVLFIALAAAPTVPSLSSSMAQWIDAAEQTVVSRALLTRPMPAGRGPLDALAMLR
jgi:hypothetical protein